MKKLSLLFIMLLCVGCGNDDDQSVLDRLEGNWISSCYELTDADDGSFITYTIDEYSFSKGSYTLQGIGYNDSECTLPSGAIDDYFGEYEIKEDLISSDGRNVTHISVTQDSPGWPEEIEPVSFEAVFFVNGDEMILGDYNNGVTPELNTTVIYTRE